MLLLVVIFPVNAKEVWKIVSLDWQPYSGANVVDQGSSVQKLRELLAQRDIALEVEFYPWARGKKLVETNSSYVGVFPAWPEDVFEGAIVSKAVDWSEISILKRKDKALNYLSIEELFKNYSVGVVSSYIYPKEIEQAMDKYPQNVEPAPNELSLLKKLSAGRGFVAITDPKVMMYLAEAENITNIEPVATIMKKELVVGFRNDERNKKRLQVLHSLLSSQE